MNHLLPQNAAQDLFHEMLRSRGIYLDLNFPYSINISSLDFSTIVSFVSETLWRPVPVSLGTCIRPRRLGVTKTL